MRILISWRRQSLLVSKVTNTLQKNHIMPSVFEVLRNTSVSKHNLNWENIWPLNQLLKIKTREFWLLTSYLLSFDNFCLSFAFACEFFCLICVWLWKTTCEQPFTHFRLKIVMTRTFCLDPLHPAENVILTPNYSIVKDSNADLTVGNWESKIDP